MSIRRSVQQNVPFPAVDVDNPPARKSGIVWSASQCQISKDGAAFANTTNLPVEIGASGRYYVTLTASEMDAVWIMLKVERADIQPWDVMMATGGHPGGVVMVDAGNTTTTFKTDRTEVSNDYWRDCLVLFTSSAGLFGQVRKVVAYNGTTNFLTVSSAYTAVPTAGDRFVLVNY